MTKRKIFFKLREERNEIIIKNNAPTGRQIEKKKQGKSIKENGRGKLNISVMASSINGINAIIKRREVSSVPVTPRN